MSEVCEHDKIQIIKGGEYVKQLKNYEWYKNNPDDKIWWVDNSETVGEWLFSFDKKHIFNMFRDYPHELTDEQKKNYQRPCGQVTVYDRKGTRLS